MSIHHYPETTVSTVCSIRWIWVDPTTSRWRRNGYYTGCCSGWRGTDTSGALERAPPMRLSMQVDEQCATGLFHAFCFLREMMLGRYRTQAARGSGAVVSGVHSYSPTTASAYRGRIALLSYRYQLSQCNQPLGGDKARDHCHIVGIYRGAAHSRCNLACRISNSDWNLPVVLHNLWWTLDCQSVEEWFRGGEGNSTEHGEVSLHHCGQTQVHRLSPIHFLESGQSREDPRSWWVPIRAGGLSHCS